MLTAAGIAFLVGMAARLQADPVDLISVAANESGISTTAHNPHGDASGLWQLMPATAKGLGWNVAVDPHLVQFRELSDVEQMHWFEKYFAPHRGKLVSAGAAYVATFLPALIDHAADPAFVMCGEHGPLAWAYGPNKGFDVAGKGCITVQDLSDAITRATARMGHRWTDLVDAIRAAQSSVSVSPLADTDPPPCTSSDDEDPSAA